jgi:phage baseplate assembly protein W
VSGFGSDFSAVDDLDPRLVTVDGVETVQQAIARRLSTPSGGLWYDENYGLDVKTFLLDTGLPIALAEARITAECLKEERVSSCITTVTVDPETEEWTVNIVPVGDDGETFSLTLLVTRDTIVTILEAA